MKSIFQMELEDKYNRKIKYREKKLKNQRIILGKQLEEIERLHNIINVLLEFLKDMFDDKAISNSFNMTKEEFIKYIKSNLNEYDKINHLEKIINQHENNIEQLKTCNSDYYNQICALTSKISLINKYINEEKNLIPLHIKDYINKIITDKTIKLGDYIDETLEISSN